MKKLIVSVLAFSPALALAAEPNLNYVTTLMGSLKNIINMALPIVVALALLAFFWGLVKFIWGGDGDKDKAKNYMVWGIVALFVMVAVWGLVGFLGQVTGIDTTAKSGNVPTVTGL